MTHQTTPTQQYEPGFAERAIDAIYDMEEAADSAASDVEAAIRSMESLHGEGLAPAARSHIRTVLGRWQGELDRQRDLVAALDAMLG